MKLHRFDTLFEKESHSKFRDKMQGTILFWNAFQLIFDGTQGYYSENGDGGPYWPFDGREFEEIEEEIAKIKTIYDVMENRARIQDLGEKILDGAEGYVAEHGKLSGNKYWNKKAFSEARKYF